MFRHRDNKTLLQTDKRLNVFIMIMQISTKGQVVIPLAIRRQLGLRAGDQLEVVLDQGTLVAKPRKRSLSKAVIRTSRRTGLPVAVAPKPSETVTSAVVRAALMDFP